MKETKLLRNAKKISFGVTLIMFPNNPRNRNWKFLII